MSAFKITTYLLFLLAINVTLNFLIVYDVIEFHTYQIQLAIQASLIGLLGGTVHCLRAVYIHRSIRNDWEGERWAFWYYLRPIVGSAMGLMSYIFLRGGLLLLTSNYDEAGGVAFTYMAIAFFAGFNVKSFLDKIESVSKEILGIKHENKNNDNDSNSNKTDVPPTTIPFGKS